ncbi:DNA segregation ATPase FtsK/SpoIIIE, S-DNA-T family [Pedococcus dokdonensis]|uniref:DNA segregation ATPase FtsK/SpoIIIE, S-DNA-T family n=1 Tax=Pedococcus dokdonensis TaxID=443156 RepID=A0A1H0R0D6_9MICO|nr:FtsK/SpoIIIE domain-containing protein [Pedococcus dokdonensis]SDP22984.1 DNA segregation ATPase FtsK/SpoIIIE, S-DNA-T family [Pedococcus dokdonensis]
MWRLSILPAPESGLEPCDVVVRAGSEADVADLARALGRHLGGERRTAPLLAPTTDGRPWPASQRLDTCGLRHGSVVNVTTVGADWLDRPAARRTPVATLRVVAGPDAGTEVALEGQSVSIGRAAACTVRLSDPLVSRSHARILVSARPVVTDEGSAHGTTVGGRPVRRAENVEWGEPVTLGGTTLVLEQGAGATATEVSVVRPPRLGEALPVAELDLPSPPQAPRPRQLPWAMVVMPLVLGMGMFATTRSRYALMYVAVWPVMMLTTHWMQSRQQRKEHQAEVAAWRAEVSEVFATLDDAARVQRQRLDADEPRTADLRSIAVSAESRLWQRQRRHDDFLTVTTGRGPVPASCTAKPARSGDRILRQEVNGALAARALLPDLPVRVRLAELACVALAASTDEVRHDALRALVTRLAVTHSPADLAFAAVLSPASRHVETWLRWLPHTGRRIDGLAPVAVGSGEGLTLLQQAVVDTSFTGDLVILVDQAAGVPVRAVEALVAQATAPQTQTTAVAAPSGAQARPRVHVLWFGTSADSAPPSSGAVLTADGDPCVALGDRGGVTPLTEVDRLDLATAWHVARTLNACRDEAALVPPESAMPDVVRLTDLGGDLHDPGDTDGVLARWAASRGLRAQLGAGADGVVTIDLREDGPHGLVAGTTGSGKSELLQTLICSLAVNNPPSRITFLLVDYKGGAAFRECADLPHSVGYITDLTPALVQRALVSLHAELTTREHLLERYGAKDLVALERSHPEVAPPSLLICVDEFAALTSEVPEFVDGMVSIAQRGRSLGMHMLLATQRPAGVVTPQIKANTDLRIALRIASEEDSHDVIDAPDAARLSRRTPGRAWVRRTGHGTTELVQVAYAGARERMRAAEEPVQVDAFSACSAEPTASSAPTDRETTDLHPRSDLDRLVTAIGDAFARSGTAAPRKPWLPALPEEVQLDGSRGVSLTTSDGVQPVVGRGDGEVVIGLIDRPAQQTQQPLVVDYAKNGHLLVFGSSGSGKTETLRTIAVSASAGPGEPAPYVYALDCGGGGLSVLSPLSSVGAVVPEQTLDRCLRLIRMVHRTVVDRNATLAAHGAADLAGLAAAGAPLPRIHLLIDNLPALVDAVERGGAARRGHVDLLLQVLQEGRRCGVHVSATTPQRVGLPAAMMACFAQRLVLRMTVDDDYAMLGAPVGVVDRDSAPGRGLHGGSEVQVATVGGAGTPEQSERLAVVERGIAPRYAGRPAVDVAAMPGRLPTSALPAGEAARLCVAVEADFVGGVWLDLREGPVTVFGRPRSGRTGFLRAVAELARRSEHPPARVVLVGPRAADSADDPVFDLVAAQPGEVLAALDSLAAPATAPAADDWTLLLVDDAHEWERGAEASGVGTGVGTGLGTGVGTGVVTGPGRGGSFRDICDALAASITTAQEQGTAVVLTGDPDEARARQHLAGPVRAARQGRRTVLLSPDLADGALASVMIPGTTLEPTAGVGRGVLCVGGQVQVVQLATAPAATSEMGA